MGRVRTSPYELTAQAADALSTALRATDIDVVEDTGSRLKARVDGRILTFDVEAVSYCTGQRARELIARSPGSKRVVPVVVADKVTSDARATLSEAGWSWLDRRGRLHVRGKGVRIDVDVPPQERSSSRAGPASPITGRGGLTVAYWLCSHRGASLSPNRSAGDLGLAPSTISTSVRTLADAGLVDDDGTGLFPELFWELAAAWHVDRTWLTQRPDPTNHQSVDAAAPRWRRTGAAAAAAYGAPVVTTEAGPVELYVPGLVEISVAVRRYGAADKGRGDASLAVAPVSAIVAGSGVERVPTLDGWPAAPLLAVALDLAQDRARGREILGGWDVKDAVWT